MQWLYIYMYIIPPIPASVSARVSIMQAFLVCWVITATTGLKTASIWSHTEPFIEHNAIIDWNKVCQKLVSQGRSKPHLITNLQPLTSHCHEGLEVEHECRSFPEYVMPQVHRSLVLPRPSTSTSGIATTVTHQHPCFPLLPLLNIAKYDAQAMVPAWEVKFQRYDTVVATRYVWLNCSIYVLNPQVSWLPPWELSIHPILIKIPHEQRLYYVCEFRGEHCWSNTYVRRGTATPAHLLCGRDKLRW